jgi:hypothetical protein
MACSTLGIDYGSGITLAKKCRGLTIKCNKFNHTLQFYDMGISTDKMTAMAMEKRCS